MLTFKQYTLLEDTYSEQPGTQYGSNDGGVYIHEPSQRKFYIKFPASAEQAHVEAAAADLYKTMGIKTLDPVVKQVHGRTAVVTPWNEHVSPMRSASNLHTAMQDPQRAHELALMHHAAVVTGNLDIVGLEYDNILQHKHLDHLISADQGGAMHYRAQGAQKDFAPSIDKELSGFQNTAYQSGRVFSKLSHDTLKQAASHLNLMTDDKIDNIMKSHGLAHLAPVVKQRRDLLKQHYGANN